MADFVRDLDADGTTVVRVIGDVDLATAEQLVYVVRPCLLEGEHVELDLAALEFIDSTGLGNLVQLRKEAARMGASLTLKNGSASALRLIEATGLAAFFGVRSDGRPHQ